MAEEKKVEKEAQQPAAAEENLQDSEPKQKKPDRSGREPTPPIVGIGASAGGLEAFEKFFTHMPANSGIGFVLVQHLDPTHESILVDLIRRYTNMEVYQVKNKMKVAPNCVYVIPPNRDLATERGVLYLKKPVMARGRRLSIDYFLRSLARDQGEWAICIILSGTGTDGTLGVQEIKGAGGMAMVQEPESAKYDGMPQSAINTDLADYILPPENMPAQLVDYVDRIFGPKAKTRTKPPAEEEEALKKVFQLLKSQTGHDFSFYKKNTIHRRLARRMTVNQVESFEEYVTFLADHPLEVELLFRELLIGVSSFFRDPEAFEGLRKEVLPALFEGRNSAEAIRVWVPGCATGEEAYSIAILLQEWMDTHLQYAKIQIFATDINDQAVEKAREGIYPASIAADVPADRLERFFDKEDSTYRIKKELREIIIFATQSLIKDPPFSKLDLISCRNLLIYLEPELQKRVIPLFHYALKPNGFMLLGSSESLGKFENLFESIDRKWKLFRRVKGQPTLDTVLDFPVPATGRRNKPGEPQERTVGIQTLTEQMLLETYAPAAVVINEWSDIVYFYGKTGPYLEPASGEASLNLLRMAREGLRVPLTTAVRKAITQKKAIKYEGLSAKDWAANRRVNVTLKPVTEPVSMQGLILVAFEEVELPKPTDQLKIDADSTELRDQRIAELEHELSSTRQYLQTTIEELETSNEELKATNEELQSSNEELQSTNEELETSKEELQSVNEELNTVNVELEDKIMELGQTNADMNNLLASIEVGAIFLDLDLRIQRFTPTATQVVNLIDSDIGRPLGHIVSNLADEDLMAQAEAVLNTLDIQTKEVQTKNGDWYWMQIRPYRTQNNAVDGVVFTFNEISETKEAQTRLYRLTQAIEHSPSMVMIMDAAGQLEYVNPGFTHLTGYPETEVAGQKVQFLAVEADEQGFFQHLERAVRSEQEWEGEFTYRTADGRLCWGLGTISPVRESDGTVTGFIAVAEDITPRKEMTEKLRQNEARFRTIFEQGPLGMALVDLDYRFLQVNNRLCEMLGYTKEELTGRAFPDITHPDDLDKDLELTNQLLAGQIPDYRLAKRYLTRENEPLWALLTGAVIRNDADQPLYALAMIEDIRARKQAEQEVDLLLRLTQTISQAPDFESALQTALDLLCQETDWVLGEAWLPDTDNTRLEASPVYYCREEDETLAKFGTASRDYTFTLGAGLPGRVWEEGEPEWQRDVSQLAEETYPRVSEAERAGLQAALGVPITGQNQTVLAVLVLYKDEAQEEQDRLVELVLAVAAQLGGLLQRKQMETDLRRSEAFLKTIYTGTEVAITVVDVTEEGQFVVAGLNPAVERLMGRSRESVVGKRMAEFDPPVGPEVIIDVEEKYAQVVESGQGVEFEQQAQLQGRPSWWLIRLEPLTDEQGRVYRIINTAVPVTRYKETEVDLDRAREIFQALGRWYRLLLQTDTPESELLHEMCRIIIEIAHYHSVWIGYAQENEAKQVKPVAHMCFEDEEITALDVSWADTESAQRPAGKAVRTGQVTMIQNVDADEGYALWREEAGRRGYRAVIALPLRDKDRSFGVVSIYAGQSERFDRAEVALLQEMADNLAYGLSFLREQKD